MEDTPPAPPLTAKGSADKVIDWMVPGSEHSVVQPGNAWTCRMAGYPGLVLTHVLVTMAFLQKSETREEWTCSAQSENSFQLQRCFSAVQKPGWLWEHLVCT